MERTFEAKDLKRQFTELKGIADLMVAPIMAVIISQFLEDLDENKERYGINIRIVKRMNRRDIFQDEILVLKGAGVIKITIDYLNICAPNGGYAYYVGAEITFWTNSIKPALIKAIHKIFLDFVGNQQLSELKREVRRELETRQVKRFFPEITQFYLE